MKAFYFGWAACAATALLAGCGGAPGRQALPLAGTSGIAPAARAIRTWMSPDARRHDLLYVSDNDGLVYVLQYPNGKLVGTLSGFTGPSGLCADGKGDVFVTDTNGEVVLEYAHGGKKPIATFLEFGAFPNGCAVDPTSGNLAVTNIATSPSQGPGNVAIYPKAQGNPTYYTAKGFMEYLFAGYDDAGNLFVDGVNNGTTQSLFAELPKGSSSMTNLTVDQAIGFPGGFQWDGKYMALEDDMKDRIYRLNFSGSTGTVAGTVQLSGHSHLMVQFWLQGSTVIVPFGGSPRNAKKIGLWNYPAGGKPAASFDGPNATELVGAAISVVPPH